MAIQNSDIGTTNTLVFSNASDQAVTAMIICNKFAYDPLNPNAYVASFTLYAVPAAEVSGTNILPKHTIVNQIPITAGETLSLDQEKLVLSAGDRLIAVSDTASALAITISTLAV